ncbi:MAG: type II secretion system F family protein [Verrucomicrobia bacterium]|nr:type II secretion system F family protein [Verrucomicrobiota bacterium]
MNWTLLIPFAAFSAIVFLGLALHTLLVKPRLHQRLLALQAREELSREERLRRPFADRALWPLVDKLANQISRFTREKRLEKLREKLVQGGLFPRLTPGRFELLQCVSGLFWLAGAAVFTVQMSLLGGQSLGQSVNLLLESESLLLALAAGVCGFAAPTVWLNRHILRRKDTIVRTLPPTLDLITIAIEAGMGFDGAMGYIRRYTGGPLGEELGRTLHEMSLGKSRPEAMLALATRTAVDEIKAIVGAILESFELGSNLADTLRIQAESIRQELRQRTQEAAMKTPVKMLFPLVFFIFPTLLLVLLGPVAITIFSAFY